MNSLPLPSGQCWQLGRCAPPAAAGVAARGRAAAGKGLLLALGLALLPLLRAQAAPVPVPEVTDFEIARGPLADALDRVAEQSGLQIVYDAKRVAGLGVQPLKGAMSLQDAMSRLLRDTGLSWTLIGGRSIVIGTAASPPPEPAHAAAAVAEPPVVIDADGKMTILSPVFVSGRRWGTDASEYSGAAFGFSKPLLETPRSITSIGRDEIDLIGVSSIEDMARVAPSTYTPTRFGIQGGIEVRSSPADTYFRGMKRLNLQGHAPSVLAAAESIEVVRGPPSPILGMGKIGGYTNSTPRSARGTDGSYLPQATSFLQSTIGSYERTETSVGTGGPMSVLGKHGGYYFFALHEDSGGYADDVPLRSDLVQLSTGLDNVLGPFRLEAGITAQKSRTAGALIGRFTQDVADAGRYIRGTPLVNLDLNGNGSIGYLEMNQASPARGRLSASNQALLQRWAWPTDANGKPLASVALFPTVAGIPQSMYDYLSSHPEADPGGVLRAQGVGGPLPVSGFVPQGMALNPATVGYDTLNLQHFAAFERELRAEMLTLYLDLIYDTDPNFTVRNQLFYDSMDQYKSSQQPYATRQDPQIFEEKLTVTRRLQNLPAWLAVNTLAAGNFRYTDSPQYQCYGDYSTHRGDAMAPTWSETLGGMTPNTTFADCVSNSDLSDDGFPYTDTGRTRFSQIGLGLMFDVDLFGGTNLLFGGRIDGSEADNVEYAGSFDEETGTSASPGAFTTADAKARGWDSAESWSVSLSQRLPFGLRPYVTVAETSLTLDTLANRIFNPVIEYGHLGKSQLKEAGIKGELFDGRLFFSSAYYEQRRIDTMGVTDPTLTAEATATRTRGWETEIKWAPLDQLLLSFYGLHQKTIYTPNLGGAILVDARTVGFQDVLDPVTGAVVFPAEAFLYGGRAFLQLPNGLDEYREKQGTPDTQLGLNALYQITNGFGASFGGQYFSSTYSGRLKLVELPSALVLNAGLFLDSRIWHLRFNVFNLNDERYFRTRNGDRLSDTTVSAMPDRHYQVTLRVDF